MIINGLGEIIAKGWLLVEEDKIIAVGRGDEIPESIRAGTAYEKISGPSVVNSPTAGSGAVYYTYRAKQFCLRFIWPFYR
jgi:hypothetical protein